MTNGKQPEYVLECDGLQSVLVPYRVQSCELGSRVHIGAALMWSATHPARAVEGRDIGYLTVMAYRRMGRGHVEHE